MGVFIVKMPVDFGYQWIGKSFSLVHLVEKEFLSMKMLYFLFGLSCSATVALLCEILAHEPICKVSNLSLLRQMISVSLFKQVE